MRPAEEMRAPRRGVTRGRVALVVLLIGLLVLATSVRGIAGFYTDFLWFDALDYSSVWRTVLGARVGLVVGFTALFFVLCWLSLWIADRVAPATRDEGPEEELIARYQELVGRRSFVVRSAVSLLFGLIAGAGTSGQWENLLLFFNRREFGETDAQFGMDVGFYVFQLPFIGFLVTWAFSAIFIITIVTTVAHYLNGGIRLQSASGPRVTPQVKAHLSLLVGLLALVKAVGYWFDRFELTLSTRGFVDGASYTDIEAQLPALNLLVLISLFSFGLLVFNIWRRGFTWPILAVGLWALVAVVAGTIYPTAIQRFRVEPAESTREAPYIARNIEATRAAIGLDDVQTRTFDYDPVLTQEELREDRVNLDNARLLDPTIAEDAFQRLEGIRGFYQFRDLDVSRYRIDGELRQVVLSARELETSGLPTQTWESTTIANTHGYGVAIAPANTVGRNGEPQFIVGGVPLDDDTDVPIDQPRIYHGEGFSGYAIVGADRDEVDFQTEDGDLALTRYDGDGGVGVGSLVRRAAFALRFNDFNMLISSELQSDSKILFNRDVRDRVAELAPFLRLDADPYPAVVGGQLVYILDGYTTTDRYPYAGRADIRQISALSGLNGTFNYARNSAKVVVNAYDGSVTVYPMDVEDPILDAYQDIFPDLFADAPPPSDLVDQFRYPEDLFRVQTNMWGRYRLSLPGAFYDATGAWNVAQDPGDTIGANNLVAETDEAGVVRQTETRIPPQYLVLELPGEDEPEFVISRSFVPFSDDDRRRELAGFMVARSEAESYGELVVYDVRSEDEVNGPSQFDAEANASEEISRRITLLDQQGSRVRPGNVLLLPIADTLMYLRPLYLQAEGATPFPRLQLIIAAVDDRIAISETVEGAVSQVLASNPGDDDGRREDPPPGDDVADDIDTLPAIPEPLEPDDDSPPLTASEVADLLRRADDAFVRADDALRGGDLAGYQELVDEARDLVTRALTSEVLGPLPGEVEPDPPDDGAQQADADVDPAPDPGDDLDAEPPDDEPDEGTSA